MNPFLNKQCKPVSAQEAVLSEQKVKENMPFITSWSFDSVDSSLSRSFKFTNYYQTISFVNAVAWVSHQQDHHPELVVNYNRCDVKYTTHSVNGITENDFICASLIDTLFNE